MWSDVPQLARGDVTHRLKCGTMYSMSLVTLSSSASASAFSSSSSSFVLLLLLLFFFFFFFSISGPYFCLILLLFDIYFRIQLWPGLAGSVGQIWPVGRQLMITILRCLIQL